MSGRPQAVDYIAFFSPKLEREVRGKHHEIMKSGTMS